ncbi:MAG: helix-turn-helix domain-containing protein [Bacteroidetes bacterium]|nr:helix-turn-helix domain-containing protein [Bacteroidota bacterium]MCL5031406.1 helix-turn-helix domain-containing protein [Bacteroidota bacterium]
MKEQNDTSASLSGTILKKLSKLEDLLKKKDDKPLTFKEACTYLGYAPSYLYKLTYKKIIPYYKPTDKIIFFSKNELDEWIFKSRPHLGPLPTRLARRDSEREEEEEIDTPALVGTRDPDQVDMFEKLHDVKEEIIIEFPLKSRRKK